MVAVALILRVFVVACSSIGKAALIIGAGALLVRREALTPQVRTGMSKMAAGLLVPCLLFDRVSNRVTWTVLGQAWPILPFGVFYVALGVALGYVMSHPCFAAMTRQRRNAAVAATAFARLL